MKHLIGIDVGTSGTKTTLFDETGKIIATHTKEYPLYQPQNGWAEQNPEDWWEAAAEGIRTVIGNAGSVEIVGIGLSGQMHGLVLLDENKSVIRNAILWCDQRTHKECKEITSIVGSKRLFEITANPALTGFTAAKILWVRKNELDNYKRCRHILLPKDYVRFKLTGVFATDVSDASGMQLLDVKNRCWSDEILERLDIDKSLLCKVYESPEVTGTITKEAAENTGLKEGCLVVAGAGDNAAAAVGTGVVSDNKAFVTIGTSGVVYAHTSKMKVDEKGRVHTFCCAVPGAWHVMGVTQAAGLSLKWFRDTLCEKEKEAAKKMGADPYVLMDKLAYQSSVGSGKLLYLPYLMGERTPHLDPFARGVFLGLSAAHSKGDMIRAVMEGVVFSLCDCACIIKKMGIKISDLAVCGGGAKSLLWRGMLSDVLNCSIKRLESSEGAALGAAILAGVGAGVYSSVEEGCEKVVKTKELCLPTVENVKKYKKYFAIFKRTYQNLKNIFYDLAKID